MYYWSVGTSVCRKERLEIIDWSDVTGFGRRDRQRGDNTAGKAKCLATLDDYYECLHHKKEHAKTFALQAAIRKAEAESGRGDGPKPEEVKTLGLLPGGPTEKNLKPGLIPAKGPSLY